MLRQAAPLEAFAFPNLWQLIVVSAKVQFFYSIQY